MVHLILLSGGSGTRLWPLSNDARSKQFLKVLRDENDNHISMVQRVFSQVNRVSVDLDVAIATCVSQQGSIEAQIKDAYSLVLEPERRDTAPAVMLACAHLAFEQGVNEDDTVIVMPIDTYADQAYYDRIADLATAVRSGAADLVLMGVEPTYPSEKYGYVIPEKRVGDAWPVREFKEKPGEEEARGYIDAGGLWNCGVFAFKLGYVVGLAKRYLDAGSYGELVEGYSRLPKTSFDYEVVEKADSVAVVPYSGTWKDLGTWNTLTEEMADPYAGRAVVDEDTCSNVHVINETGFPLVVAGLRDAVVVATPDGILVSGKEESARIKGQVARAAETRPMYEQRRWGEYRVLDSSAYPDGRKSLTKELVIEAGRQLSYQVHARRSEVWTVVSGSGRVVLDGDERVVEPGSVVRVPAGARHAVRADGAMRIIEVQLGDVLVEDDIERFGSWWA